MFIIDLVRILWSKLMLMREVGQFRRQFHQACQAWHLDEQWPELQAIYKDARKIVQNGRCDLTAQQLLDSLFPFAHISYAKNGITVWEEKQPCVLTPFHVAQYFLGHNTKSPVTRVVIDPTGTHLYGHGRELLFFKGLSTNPNHRRLLDGTAGFDSAIALFEKLSGKHIEEFLGHKERQQDFIVLYHGLLGWSVPSSRPESA